MSKRMVTTNISLPRDDWKALKLLAFEYGVSMTELVRRGVSVILEKLERPKLGSAEWWAKANLQAMRDFEKGNYESFEDIDEAIKWLKK